MKNVLKTAVLSLTLVGGASTAFAAGHADVTAMTCAEFSAMDLSAQDESLAALAATVEGVEREEFEAGDIEVLCNGRDDDTIAMIIEDDEE
ncbi:hypothetical protein ACJ5NV_08220 [Loktanella agnita]|uniref:hypothetical protein n=1 Tax=Loktanella agnita TaxID=287097 RepID=UPI0039876B7C